MNYLTSDLEWLSFVNISEIALNKSYRCNPTQELVYKSCKLFVELLLTVSMSCVDMMKKISYELL